MPWLYKKKLLSPAQLKRLTEHKYSCTSISLLDPFLQPWWCWLVSKTPLWLAPNLITIVGLAVNIITTLILISYSPDGKVFPPRWASGLCGLGLLIYQSLDAIDGKQARRTNSSSPLGELFDHGCDSVSTIFVALSACISCQLGVYPNWMFFQCFCAIILFYCAHWQTYVSGTLRFGKVDVTEAQITIVGIHMISMFFGPDIWLAKIPMIGLTWNHVPVLSFSFGYFQVFLSFLNSFVIGGVGKNGSTVALPYLEWDSRLVPLYFAFAVDMMLALRYVKVIFTGGCGKNGSTVAGTSVLSPIIPLFLVVVPAFIIAQKSQDHIFEVYPSLYIITFGLVAAKVTNKLVIAHMTRSEMEYSDWGLLGPLLLFLNQYFNNFIPEIYILWFAFFWGLQDLCRYCTQICLEICEHLKIQLFRIPYPPKPPLTVSQGTNAPPVDGNIYSSSHDKNGTHGHQHRKQNKLSKKQQHVH
ncbi:cholinephosphotransferase 1 isoform X6 [Hermetia illucens]|uniref:cholinephosphotransferase 1 isoform X6 n=1 Tax=Hermetia illucens TaxID=343691 RepID=UPI0018CC1F05|nr:cholinephosphotransferase 1 isoform X6 [Hermetia illucens]